MNGHVLGDQKFLVFWKIPAIELGPPFIAWRPRVETTQRMVCFLKRLLLTVICSVSALSVSNNANAAFGDVVAQYTFPASAFVMHPTQPRMYATIPSQNSIAIINTNTFAVEDTVFVGSGPINLAFSPDGLKAYIANST